MMHRERRWCVSEVTTPEELAHMLTERTWTLCSGFRVQGHDQYLFLNDATHEDGAAEFAIVKGTLGEDRFLQVESITFSWCSFERALALIRSAIASEYDTNDFAVELSLKVEPAGVHARCHLCA